MVRLSPETKRADFLNVLAAQRRELALRICTDRPLRKPKTATQRRQLAALREEARLQISAQLDAQTRRAFRGRVAVELRLGLPGTERHDAGLPALVKAYIDLLKGPVVFDDARVEHLLVLRQPSTDTRTTVLARCLPVSVFAAEYDRAFRLLSELDTLPEPQPPLLDGQPVTWTWGLRRFDRYAREVVLEEERALSIVEELDLEEAKQLAEDPDTDVDLEIPSWLAELAGAEVRAGARAQLQRATAYARGEQISDLGFDIRDRPDGIPGWFREMREGAAAELVALDDRTPGCFVLPAPLERPAAADEPDWPALISQSFAERAQTRPWRHARFGGPLALDIALRGRAGRTMDLDNAAHQILREFERVFAPNEPAVTGYRSYRKPGPGDDVRVRVLPAVRLELLSRTMDDARALARR